MIYKLLMLLPLFFLGIGLGYMLVFAVSEQPLTSVWILMGYLGWVWAWKLGELMEKKGRKSLWEK